MPRPASPTPATRSRTSTDLLVEIGEVLQTRADRRAVPARRDAQPRHALAGGDLHRVPGDQPPRPAGRARGRRPPRPPGAPDVGEALRRPPVRLPRAGTPLRRGGAGRARRPGRDARRRVRRGRGASGRRGGRRLPVLHPGVRPGALEPGGAARRSRWRRRERPRDRARLAGGGSSARASRCATDAEQRYLAAMAALGAAPCRPADVARAFGARTSAASR